MQQLQSWLHAEQREPELLVQEVVSTELPLHGELPLWPLDRVMVPVPQLVEQDPHAPQPYHDPST